MAAQRERINTGNDARYVRRDAKGRFNEVDDVGRSQRADKAIKAKTVAKTGQGDKGDHKKARKH